MITNVVTKELMELRNCFKQRGFDIRLVGGVVRDFVAGVACKDIDLCTDANPSEQIDIYQKNGYRHIATGIDHGTITVVVNNIPYEITSLRIDAETDGRHAKVEFTSDWIADLARRDLTINAMSMTFDGDIIDPFNGKRDLEEGRIVFVGDAEQRIQEDYLRILRWFRFFGRFGNPNIICEQTAYQIARNAKGLRSISRERIWNEIKKIVMQEKGSFLIEDMVNWYIADHIDLPESWSKHICKIAREHTSNPEVLMAAGLRWSAEKVQKLAEDWKWSNAEKDHAMWIVNNVGTGTDLRRFIAVDNISRDWVAELAALEQRDAWEQNALVHWHFEPFPVTGHDLMAAGMKPGRAMGETLNKMRNAWADSGFVASKEELMRVVNGNS